MSTTIQIEIGCEPNSTECGDCMNKSHDGTPFGLSCDIFGERLDASEKGSSRTLDYQLTIHRLPRCIEAEKELSEARREGHWTREPPIGRPGFYKIYYRWSYGTTEWKLKYVNVDIKVGDAHFALSGGLFCPIKADWIWWWSHPETLPEPPELGEDDDG